MAYIEKVRFKNLLSYGNNWTEFEFKEGINRIFGSNGDGKSTVAEALYFGLFGKPYRSINLSQLVNTINKKDLQVEVYFKNSAGDSYVIERGLKPNFLKVYKNGRDTEHLIPVPAASKNYQQLLEEEHLKVTPNFFDQTGIKSLTKSFSFFSLPKEKKREIIEIILDVKVYSDMNKLAKLKVDALDKELTAIKKDIEYTSILIEQEVQNLNNLRRIQKEITEDVTAKVTQINNEISTLKSDIETKTQQLDKISSIKTKRVELVQKLNDAKQAFTLSENSFRAVSNKISLIKEKVVFLQNTCGACPKIKEIAETEDVGALLEEKKMVQQRMREYEENIQTINSNISKCDTYIVHENSLRQQISSNERLIAQKLSSVKEEKSKNIIIDESKLLGYNFKKAELEKLYDQKHHERKHYAFARTQLTDDTIKASVVKTYLPSINSLLNMYLQKFGSEIIFEFDSEFEEVVKSRHKETFSYESFSEGQKRRIDLSILFMFIKFCNLKSKQANTNVMILDEVGTGLDSATENRLHEILKELTLEENKSIIAISHNESINPEYTDHTYRATMKGGFSELAPVLAA